MLRGLLTAGFVAGAVQFAAERGAGWVLGCTSQSWGRSQAVSKDDGGKNYMSVVMEFQQLGRALRTR